MHERQCVALGWPCTSANIRKVQRGSAGKGLQTLFAPYIKYLKTSSASLCAIQPKSLSSQRTPLQNFSSLGSTYSAPY